jgi:ArsR family transcriptional regulator
MDKLTNLFKILSDETRLRMIILLYQEELCVCEISGVLEAPQPRISKNLSKLRDLNLVDDERKERYVFYALRKDNKVLNKILKDILNNIDEYPQIGADRNKLKDKDKFSSICDGTL